MMRLTVLYDADCSLCVRCARFLTSQPALVEVELLPCGSTAARARFGEVPWLGQELVVVSDAGEVWAGAAAFLVCLWALRDWREWSYRLATPALAPLARRLFAAVSAGRRGISRWLPPSELGCSDRRCHALVAQGSEGPFR
jgi:predicted DCC family thiol-disulfide oxidoreductase YuxK